MTKDQAIHMITDQDFSTQDIPTGSVPKYNFCKKEKIGVVIFTDHYKIIGFAFKDQGLRFSDHLNNISDEFISLSDVQILLLNNNELISELKFLAINKSQIQLITETEKK